MLTGLFVVVGFRHQYCQGLLLIRRVWEAAKGSTSTDMPPGSINLESQLLSIMDVLVKTAVSEISQLFSENSASLCMQLTQSLRENEAMRTRMSVMRSELFSLRLQTRSNRPASRFSQLKGIVPKPRAKPKVFIKLPVLENAASGSAQLENKPSAVQTRQKDVETEDVILIKDEDDVGECEAAADQKHSGHKRDQEDDGTGSLDLQSSCPADTGEELRILSVHGRGEGPLQDMEDGLFPSSELENFSSLSPYHNVTHDSLLNFPRGAADRVPMMESRQDKGDEVIRNSQQENQSTQMAAAVGDTLFVGADSQTGHPSDVSQFPQQPNIFIPSDPQNLDCSFCGKHFTSPTDLIAHRATHMSKNPRICSYCGKSFFKKNSLTIHLRIHTGEKPYACTQCGKRFTHSGSLKIHLRTHSGEKPYTCKQCSASFNNLSNLRRHMVTHSTFEI